MDEGALTVLQKDLRNLAILEVIVGGGYSLACVTNPLFSMISASDANGILLIVLALLGSAGCICVAIGYFSGWKVIPQVKGALLGILGCACMINTFTIPMRLRTTTLVVGFCFGSGVLLLGYRLWRMYRWSRIAQSIFHILLSVFVAYLLAEEWQSTLRWRWSAGWLAAAAIFTSGGILLLAGHFVASKPYEKTILRSAGGAVLVVYAALVAILLWQDRFVWRWPKEAILLIGVLLVLSPLRVFLLFQHPHCKSLFTTATSPPDAGVPTFTRAGVSTLMLFFLSLMALGSVLAPSFLQSVQRGKQRLTMAYFFVFSAVMEAYALDHGVYPPAETMDQLAAMLEPKYVKAMPRLDGWNRPIEYYRITLSKTGVQGFVFRSAGRDGKYEYSDPTAYSNEPVEGFDRDLVYSTVSGSRWPEGTMAP